MIVTKDLSQIQPAKKRRLDPETKYQIFIEATRGDIPQVEVLRKWGVYASDLKRIKEQVRTGAIKELKARNSRKKHRNPEVEELEMEKRRLEEALKELAIENTLLKKRVD